MSTAIKVENLSKAYQLGEIGTGTISRDLERWWAKKRGKEDPFLKIGEVNNREVKGMSDVVWSLKDLDFEIEQGEAIGIIGKNGAGKSTLLKLLSRVTSPTTGVIKIKGRIASLLEVGTGFHPELTGRENIYLNGAILGMRKREIKRKFDEIVDFAGVERYIDTPVKRYSSGMYVRLAFAVAAHLESEILIVDEVLAVGDADFQKKCLGKMGDVSKGEGRTVLFVSHNMASIKALCTKGILLQNGELIQKGKVNEIVSTYLSVADKPYSINEIENDHRLYSTGEAYVRSLDIKNNEGNILKAIPYKKAIVIGVVIEIVKAISDLIIDVKIVSKEGIELTLSQSNMDNLSVLELGVGIYSFDIEIENQFQPGNYFITVGLHHATGTTIDYLETILGFEVLNFSSEESIDHNQFWSHGYIRPTTKWKALS